MVQFTRRQFARFRYDSLQDVMLQFVRFRYDSLQDDSLQDVIGMNTICRNMVHSLNLDSIWIYDHKNENA